MNQSPVHDQIVAFLAETTSHAESKLRPETRLFDGGLELDSFATVALISQIENHYDFEFSDEDFQPENFVDLATLCALVETYLTPPPKTASG